MPDRKDACVDGYLRPPGARDRRVSPVPRESPVNASKEYTLQDFLLGVKPSSAFLIYDYAGIAMVVTPDNLRFPTAVSDEARIRQQWRIPAGFEFDKDKLAEEQDLGDGCSIYWNFPQKGAIIDLHSREATGARHIT